MNILPSVDIVPSVTFWLGECVERIKTEGRWPTNCVFGPPGSKKLYVTEDELGTMEVFDVGTDGLPLYTG